MISDLRTVDGSNITGQSGHHGRQLPRVGSGPTATTSSSNSSNYLRRRLSFTSVLFNCSQDNTSYLMLPNTPRPLASRALSRLPQPARSTRLASVIAPASRAISTRSNTRTAAALVGTPQGSWHSRKFASAAGMHGCLFRLGRALRHGPDASFTSLQRSAHKPLFDKILIANR